MDKILETITAIVETYEGGHYKDLNEMHRQLVCNMFYLSKEQVKAHTNWNKEYYLSNEKSNAGKERNADKLVPELYLIRKIMETAKSVSIAMTLEIKMN